MTDRRWSDLALGDKASFDVQVSAEMLDCFARVSGDHNPLHMDDTFAVALGFAGRVAFGMLTASFYSRLVGMHLPGKHALLHGVDLEFKSPAYIGDVLTVAGEVVFLNDAYRRLEIIAHIVNQHGKMISKANIRVGVHES